MSTPVESARRRSAIRWWQARRGVLFVGCLVAVLGVGQFSFRIWRAAGQRSAVERVRELGGDVLYSYEYPDSGHPKVPAGFRRLLGIDFFYSVLVVKLDGSEVRDQDLKVLRRMPKLRWVFLRNTSISDAGFDELKRLPDLVHVFVRDTRVTRAAVCDLEASLPSAQCWPSPGSEYWGSQ